MSYLMCGDLESIKCSKVFLKMYLEEEFMGKKLSNEEFIRRVIEKNEHVRNGEIEILGEYTLSSDNIECFCHRHNIQWSPIASSLYKNIGCQQCKSEKISINKSKSHKDFVNELSLINNHLTVMSEYNGMYNDIDIQCKNGHVWTTKPVNVLYEHHECPYCSGQSILRGFNDLWTTSIETAVLLENPEDGYKFTKGSGQLASFKCPLCSKVQNKYIKNVVNRGFQCAYCSDTISYPNKFGRALLDQLLGGNYITEWQPDWAKPYRYDNYFEYDGKQYILEMDGEFHYSDKDGFYISLQERQKVDCIKNNLAVEHGVIMIRIDSRRSSCDYIMHNIINSKLSQIFNLSMVDWKKCDTQAQKNLIKTVCDLYMYETKSCKEISKILKIATSTARNYLKIGFNLGWCDYNPKIHKATLTIQI